MCHVPLRQWVQQELTQIRKEQQDQQEVQSNQVTPKCLASVLHRVTIPFISATNKIVFVILTGIA